MTPTPREPHADNDIIDEAEELPTPSQGGSSGGELAREIGQRDEDKSALGDAGKGRDPQVTAVRKGDKPAEGDATNLPNRTGGSQPDRAPPRRTN
ncbi:MAG: hypothetical protein ACREBK_07740 [Sphingomicrobium sp.]